MEDSYIQNTPSQNTRALNLAKVFGYMFIGLLITAGVAFLFGFIFNNWYINDPYNADKGIMIIMVITSITTIVLTLVINFVLLRGKHKILIPAILYTVCMGLMLSTFVLYIDWRILGVAFGVTSLIFGILALIAFLVKDKVGGIALAMITLLFGAGIMSLTSFILVLCLNPSAPYLIWITDFVIFGVVMLSTIVNIANINNMSKYGTLDTNIALYFAFQIYVDFIYMFIRLVYYIALFTSKR